MKKLIALFSLMAVTAFANTNYLAIVVKDDIDNPDKTVGKLKMKEYFDDSVELDWDALTKFCKTSDTSEVWRVVCFAINKGTVKKLNKNKDEIDAWKNGNMSQSNKVVIISCGENPLDDLLTAGFQPVVTEHQP